MTLLKQDLFGTVALLESAQGQKRVVRDTGAARWWLAGLARHLARRDRDLHVRIKIPGTPVPQTV